VHLSLPSDALEGRAAALLDALPESADFAARPLPLHAAPARELLAWLQAGERPLVLAGPGALTRPGRRAAAALQAAAGVPVIGMESPRGVADPSLGALAEVLAQADRVLLLGKRLDFTLKFGQAPFAAGTRWATVDADADEVERCRRAVGARLDLSALADLPSACAALAAEARAEARHAGWCTAVAEATAWRPPAWAGLRSATPGRLHPLEMLRPLQALLDSHPDAVFISDGGEIGQWAQGLLHAPQRVVNGVAGSIGSALPFALAARCALPPEVPVVAVMGDGTAGFHLTEFDTALRCALPFVAVIGNDARWNAEYQIQLKDYGAGRLFGCELAPTRYDLAAAGLGAHGEHVERAEDLPAALQRAHASARPACLNVMIEGAAAPQFKRPAA
jgi:acetolactate synthase-1/2/3 large subunit